MKTQFKSNICVNLTQTKIHFLQCLRHSSSLAIPNGESARTRSRVLMRSGSREKYTIISTYRMSSHPFDIIFFLPQGGFMASVSSKPSSTIADLRPSSSLPIPKNKWARTRNYVLRWSGSREKYTIISTSH